MSVRAQHRRPRPGRNRTGDLTRQLLSAKVPDMSRITLSYTPEVIAGWDRAMATYFFQVFDDEGEVVVDVGTFNDRILTTTELRRRVPQWEDFLPPLITAKLREHKTLNMGSMEVDYATELSRFV